MLDNKERDHLYSFICEFATGSTLHQFQNGELRLIGYASKRVPTAAQKYSIAELKLCTSAINIAVFSHLFKTLAFYAAVDHLALQYIMKTK